jgi:hypothetical protein
MYDSRRGFKALTSLCKYLILFRRIHGIRACTGHGKGYQRTTTSAPLIVKERKPFPKEVQQIIDQPSISFAGIMLKLRMKEELCGAKMQMGRRKDLQPVFQCPASKILHPQSPSELFRSWKEKVHLLPPAKRPNILNKKGRLNAKIVTQPLEHQQ